MTSHRGGDLRPDAPFAISWRCSVSPRSEPLDRSGTWQLAVPGHLRLAAGPVRGPRTGTRALPPGRPPRPGRLHRHDGGRATSGYAGRVVPSPRVGLPRLVRRGWCSRHQAQPPQGLDRTQPCPFGDGIPFGLQYPGIPTEEEAFAVTDQLARLGLDAAVVRPV